MNCDSDSVTSDLQFFYRNLMMEIQVCNVNIQSLSQFHVDIYIFQGKRNQNVAESCHKHKYMMYDTAQSSESNIRVFTNDRLLCMKDLAVSCELCEEL